MTSLLKETYNTRYIPSNGNPSSLIRSDKIDGCSHQTIAYLCSSGITTVIDLRDLSNKQINPYLSKYGIDLINCPMSARIDKDKFLQQ